MSNKIVVQLAPRSVAFYDRETNMHLTLSTPRGEIPAGAEFKNIRNGLNAGTIVLIEGDLDGESTSKEDQETTEQENEPDTSQEKTDEYEEEVQEEEPQEEEGSLEYTYNELDEMYVKDLKEIAKDVGLTGYSNMKKEELIDVLLKEF